MIEADTKQKMKTFWQRPEGKMGAVFLIGLVIILILYSAPIFAFIIGLLQGLITTIALFVVLGIIKTPHRIEDLVIKQKIMEEMGFHKITGELENIGSIVTEINLRNRKYCGD